MKKLKFALLSITVFLFTACGTGTQVDTTKVFDLWEYMTSDRDYDVVYNVYENDRRVGQYEETHIQYGDEYERQSNSGTTRLLANSNRILMQEPSGDNISIVRYVYLGDRGIFQSSDIQTCSFERFYDTYRTQDNTFYNVIQVSCTTHSGLYSEYYYAYNEGIVAFYQKDGNQEKEYIKISESRL